MAVTRRHARNTAEWVFITLGLFLLTESFAQLLESGGSLEGGSNPRQLTAALMIYSVAAALVLHRPGPAARTLIRRPELMLIILLPLASSLWTAEHDVVLRRAAAHALTVVFCLYLADRMTPEALMQRLLLVLLIGGVASLVLGALHTNFAVTPEGPNAGAWRGIYGHKAFLGRNACLAIFTALVARPRNARERLIAIACLVVFGILCIASQSRSAWLQLIGGGCFLAVLAVLKTPRVSSGIKLTLGGVLAGGAIAAGLAAFTDLLTVFGRTPTFSGRTSLWEGAIKVAAESHPWFGAGYRGFWLGDTSSRVHAYVASFQKVPAHAHNGYLDTWFELGWFGVAVFTVFVLLTAFRVLQHLLRDTQSRVWVFFLMQIMLFLATNLGATVAFRHSDIGWAMVILASIYTLRQAPPRPSRSTAATHVRLRAARPLQPQEAG
jgi:exopolysaccharide production protein ExoQ